MEANIIPSAIESPPKRPLSHLLHVTYYLQVIETLGQMRGDVFPLRSKIQPIVAQTRRHCQSGSIDEEQAKLQESAKRGFHSQY